MFILKVNGGNYVLMDGLQFMSYTIPGGSDSVDPNAIPESPLRLNGDYPAGTYTFVGSGGYPPLPIYYNQQPNLYLNGFDGYTFTLQIK